MNPQFLVATIRSGGQSGVDRGALDAARAGGVPVTGWCPAGGWAEDFTTPPGLLVDYPELRETPSAEISQRTEWNVRDSDATVILTDSGSSSPGTDLTAEFARRHGRPCIIVGTGRANDVVAWVRSRREGCERALDINIAGPRSSEWAGAYEASFQLVQRLIHAADG